MTMPIRFIDGFDTIDSTHETIRWTGGSASVSSPGRFGYGQYGQPVGLFKSFTGGPFVYAMAAGAFKWTAIAGEAVILEFGSNNQHCRLMRDASGFPILKNASSVIIATYNAQACVADTWYAFGFAAKWSSTGAGQLRAWFNGHLIMSEDNVDTDNDVDEISYVLIGSHCDDFYCSANDTITGNLEDEYRGDLVVRESFPVSDGEHEDWTPLSGSDSFAMIDEIGPDDDTTYLHSNTAGHRSCFSMTPASADLSSIIAVQLNSIARFDTTGPHDIRNYVRQVGVANHDQAAKAIAVTYAAHHDVLETDPVTGVAWTPSGFDSRQFGVKLDV